MSTFKAMTGTDTKQEHFYTVKGNTTSSYIFTSINAELH